MKPFPCMLALAATVALTAQDQATTLLAATQQAQVVVRATVLSASDPSPDWHRVSFRSLEVLSGNLATEFVLLEPAGACCGRSLFAMSAGEQYLLFLRREGPRWHSVGGSRGILADDPALTAHVRSLLQAGSAAATKQVLVQGLAANLPRITDDAALALASLPQLQLQAGDRTQIAACLQEAVAHGRALAPSLADILVRDGGSDAIDTLLPLYLRTPHCGQASMLQRALGRCPSSSLLQRLPLHLDDHAGRCLRAIDLLADLDGAEAIAGIEGLLRTHRDVRVQFHAATTLLQRDVSPARLRLSAPAPLVELAQQQRLRSATPRFRLLEHRRR